MMDLVEQKEETELVLVVKWRIKNKESILYYETWKERKSKVIVMIKSCSCFYW